MAALNGKTKLTKSDAETIAVGQQISGELEKRLRSESGKSYTVGINISPNEMGSIQEILEAGGIDHADDSQVNDHGQDQPNDRCCTQASQIIELIKKLQTSVDDTNAKVTNFSVFQQNAENKFKKIEDQQLKDGKEIRHVLELAQQSQLKIDILADIVVRQHQEIENLKGTITDVQVRSMANNITITGIPQSTNENCIQKVNQFLVDQLLIKDKMIPIEQAYRFGSGSARPMLVMLRHARDKEIIFEHVQNLKGKKINNVQCFVAPQLPEAANEKRREINNAMYKNKKLPAKEKLALSVKQGQLLLKGKPVEIKVKRPTPFQMMSLSDPEIDQLNDMTFAKGVPEEESESMFHGYAISVTNHQEINQAYKSLMLRHGQASHISCIYRLRSVAPPYKEGGYDDGEFGAMRNVLPILQDGNLENVAVFVIRYFGGVKLGPRRFELIKKVATSALTGWQVELRSTPQNDLNGWGSDVQPTHSENEEEQEEI